MKLLELKSTRNWEWKNKQPHTMSAEFAVNDKTYIVSFVKYQTGSLVMDPELSEELPPILWVVVFTLNDNPRITKTGNEMQVFATVFDITRDFVKHQRPEGIAFGADFKEPSRVPLYQRILRMFSSQGWETTEYPDNDEKVTYFIAWR